ncbi:MAG: MFS transporter [Nitrososphaerota archaeon]|jgi:MFS family permease|nr:MFS transporter [Nitrososphaerota archaeon]MDG6932013.1 MFS transporter [Nitrososphaerota archaeon]MDG6935637.1 MFS transporter [Nitrososphaerota archaeon]MDG6944466.1 MFS transporter [Nitrososphaerota archaeon]
MHTNAKLAIISRGLISFAYGFLMVIFPLYLYSLGYDLVTVGLVIFAAMIINALLAFLLGMLADHYGRKYIMSLLFALFAVSSGLFLIANNAALLAVLAGLAGFTTGSTGGPIGSGGPVGGIQTAIISETVDNRTMPRILGIASVTEMAAAMVGAYVIPLVEYAHIFVYDLFYAGLVIGIASFASSVFIKDLKIRSRKLLPSISFKNIFRLSLPTIPCGLGSGLIIPILSLWLKLRYNVSTGTIGAVFGTMNVFVIISMLLMPRMAMKVGKLKVIVLSRVAASLAFILMAFSAAFPLAAFFIIARGSFAMGSMPVRQSFVMTNVHETERATTNGATSLSRNGSSSFGPIISGYMMPVDMAYIPLVGGIITMFDPLLYYLMFRGQWHEKGMAEKH